MGIGIRKVNHVNVTVPAEREADARRFYGDLLGLQQITKPPGPRQNIGAWYQLGESQLHLSIEDGVHQDERDAHVCYQVADVTVAEREFRDAGVEVISDPRPTGRQARFFVRDPGGNLIEITSG